MERLQNISETIARAGIYVGGVLLIFSAVLVAAEVLLRKFFDYSIQGADEYSGYILAITVTWGFSYALHRRAHIRIDALYVKLPYRVCCVLDLIALLSLLVFFSILSYLAVEVLLESIRLGAQANTVRRTPLWIPQGIWVAGLIFFVWNILLVSVRTAGFLIAGDYENVRALAGAPSVIEEMEEELHLTEHASEYKQHAEELSRRLSGRSDT